MQHLNTESLAATVDAVNEAFFFGKPISKTERERTAKWIASRQGGMFAYAGMFAPTETDLRNDLRLFTGEAVKSGAGRCHVLGEEACRALFLLNTQHPSVDKALVQARRGVMEHIAGQIRRTAQGGLSGRFCCGTCTPSLWRHLAAARSGQSRRFLEAGLKGLNQLRDGKGRWRSHPFHYTLLALHDLAESDATNLSSVRQELKYAAPACERIVRKDCGEDLFALRRKALAERVLEKV